jgi:hypothetical protein
MDSAVDAASRNRACGIRECTSEDRRQNQSGTAAHRARILYPMIRLLAVHAAGQATPTCPVASTVCRPKWRLRWSRIGTPYRQSETTEGMPSRAFALSWLPRALLGNIEPHHRRSKST